MEKRTLSMLNLEDAQAVVDAAREEARANPRSKHEILAEIIAEIPKIEKSLAENQKIIPHLDLSQPRSSKGVRPYGIAVRGATGVPQNCETGINRLVQTNDNQ